MNRIEICSRNSSVYPEDLGGHYRLQGETQWLLKGPEEQIKQVAASLAGLCEPVTDEVLLVNFGNSVGWFRIPRVGLLEVVSGKWDSGHFNTILLDLSVWASSLPFSMGGGSVGVEWNTAASPATRASTTKSTIRSGSSPAMLLLDASGMPLRPSIQQNDVRAITEVEELRVAVDLQEFLRVTGGVPNQQSIDTKWRWLQRHKPEIVERTTHICGSYDFIVYHLTGHYSLEENWAVESELYDVGRHHWHAPYLEHAGIDPSLLPQVHSPIKIMAGVSEEAANVTGLRVGTPVVAGSADHVAAALAAGLTQGGDILLKFGGAGDILYCDERPDPDPHFYFDYHGVPGLTLINGCMASSGSLVKWFSRELAGGTSPQELDSKAQAIEPGAGGIFALPYFLREKTPIFDPAARGVSAGVMLHHTRAHLYRAILEAVCYGFAHHLALLREARRAIRRIVAADRGSRSALWMQIVANVVDLPVQVVAGEAASALGAAYVAAMGVGMRNDWSDIERFISQGPVYYLQSSTAQRYRKGFALYRDLYTRLQTYPTRTWSVRHLRCAGIRCCKMRKNDWGLYKTLDTNLKKMKAFALERHFPLQVAERIDNLLAAIDQQPKSLSWKARSMIGERVPWYELPEEPHE